MKLISLFLLLFFLSSSTEAQLKFRKTGEASYYSDKMNYHRVACGERYCKDSFIAAHRTLPFGTYVKVTNLKNNKTVVVRIVDRGPRKRSRIIDLSGAAADMLDMRRAGVARVSMDIATAEDLMSQQKLLSDSLQKDTTSVHTRASNARDTVFEEWYMIQGGAYRTLAAAEHIKSYLENECITGIHIRKSRWHRRHIYKVMIGPVNPSEKENILCLLKNKGLSAFVKRI